MKARPSNRPPNTESLNSLEIATLNEYKKIRDRLELERLPDKEQIEVLLGEVDRVSYLLQLEKISIAGGSAYRNKLVEMQVVITAQSSVIQGLESEVIRLRK